MAPPERDRLPTVPAVPTTATLAPAAAAPPRTGQAHVDALRELAELPLPALRARRRSLHEELRRVRHWHRLVQARNDLLVAAAVAVDDLEVPLEASSDGGPLEHHLGSVLGELPGEGALPPLSAAAVADPGGVLRGLVLGGLAGSDGHRQGRLPEHLRDLSAARKRLAGYADALEGELDLVTGVLVERCGRSFGGT